jgi:hypothetical protein
LQQKPWAQKPLPHWAAAEQEAPLVLRPQEFMAQLLGALHWSLVAQALKHCVLLQT